MTATLEQVDAVYDMIQRYVSDLVLVTSAEGLEQTLADPYLIGSLLGPKPTPAEQAYFEELRDPSGDALYDRAQRRAAAAASQ